MRTLYRSLLRMLPRFGVQVLDLGAGTAVLSRRGERTRVRVGREADLVIRGEGPYTAARMRQGVWVVARGRGDPAATWKSVPLGNTGAQLLLDGSGAADERSLQLAAATFLCTHHVAGLLEHYGVNCVFDVGANAGQYAKRLRGLGYTGRIVSFEPTEDAFAKLRQASDPDPEWWVYPFGLGREDATHSIHVDWNTMNSLLPPSEYGKGRYRRFARTRTEEIELRRLDGVMDKALAGLAEPRPYLKMDTQGYDLEVFAGAGDRAGEFVGMQSEVAALPLYEGSPRMAEAIAVYEESGFEITGMYPVTREATTGRVVEFDCVMMRAAAAPG